MTRRHVVNILFVLFIGNIFGVLAASNLGYVLAHMFALSGFVILRQDRPTGRDPIRLGRIWTPIAAVLAVWCVILTSSASAGCRCGRAATATRRRRSSGSRSRLGILISFQAYRADKRSALARRGSGR
jgi:amino acid transporter